MKTAELRRALRSWGRRQSYSFFSSLGTLLSHRLGTLMTVLVLGIAMALPLGLYIAVSNLRAMDLEPEEWSAITVFLQPGVGTEEATALAQLIQQDFPASVETVSPVQGLEQFREASGFGQALDFFEANPLPWVLLVNLTPSDPGDLGSVTAGLDAWLQDRAEVEWVQVDYKWLQRLAGLLAMGQALVSVLAVLFSLAVVVVVANTIRLDVASRKEEIQVLSLVGAGDGFIRQPFLYSGFWYGVLGALLALLLFNIGLYYLGQPLERLIDAYGNRFEVQNFDGTAVFLVLLAGGLLGLFGAWISVQRHLRQVRDSQESGGL